MLFGPRVLRSRAVLHEKTCGIQIQSHQIALDTATAYEKLKLWWYVSGALDDGQNHAAETRGIWAYAAAS